MAQRKEPINPFYVLSGLVGVAFCITAFAYYLMLIKVNHGQGIADDSDRVHPLLNLLDQHGLMILVIEVLLIGIVSIAAIALDHYRGKRIRLKADNNRTNMEEQTAHRGE
ncbi:MAG: hypothetical protein IT427_01705 [Pirellulales bacterium]|nr:hypothetical protein [Pirellulales bacterium]